MKIRFLTVAETEQAQAAAYYESQRIGLGSEFVEELDRTAGRILEFPNAWSFSSRNTRACQMKRFPYSMIYGFMARKLSLLRCSTIAKTRGDGKTEASNSFRHGGVL